MFILFIYTFVLAGDTWWWLFLNRVSRRAGLSRGWHRAIAGVMGGSIFCVLLLIVARVLHLHIQVLPESVVAWLFIWHVIILPPMTVLSLFGAGIGKLFQSIKPAPDAAAISARRQFLAGAIVIIPPVAAAVLTGYAAETEDDMRIRRVELPLQNLPQALDGLTIAQMTDPHLGSFISDRKYQKIIEMTNALDADLVFQTGDLINASLSDLPDGIAMARAFKSRYGVYCCEGNHDVMMDRDAFERDTKQADINMLLDESRVIEIRGQKLRLTAPRWVGYDESSIVRAVQQLVPTPPTDIFTIMLAHHPHNFDAAARAGVPLVLSGHTHGGQLALTQNIGIGPLMYRYWSGLYRKPNSACFVSNGTGNWFPLRINAPCEIIHLTLRRAKDSQAARGTVT